MERDEGEVESACVMLIEETSADDDNDDGSNVVEDLDVRFAEEDN